MAKNMKRIQRIGIKHKHLGVGSFARVNVNAFAEVTLLGQTPIQVIESRCEYGVYPENVTGLPTVEKERLAELADQLHAIGFSRRAIAAAMREVQHGS